MIIKQTNPRKTSTQYQVYIPASAVKDLAGNNLAAVYSYQFKTAPPDTKAPIVTGTDPTNGATGVSLISPVVITFSENILAGTNYSKIYIKNLSSGAVVSIASKTISGNTLTIKQTNPRKANTQYQVYIPASAVKDTSSNNLAAAYTYTFTTA
jgi:hypothetical protein